MDLRNRKVAMVCGALLSILTILIFLLGYLSFESFVENGDEGNEVSTESGTVPGKGNSIILLKDGIVQMVIPVEKVAETCIDGQVMIISWKKEKCNESNKR